MCATLFSLRRVHCVRYRRARRTRCTSTRRRTSTAHKVPALPTVHECTLLILVCALCVLQVRVTAAITARDDEGSPALSETVAALEALTADVTEVMLQGPHRHTVHAL